MSCRTCAKPVGTASTGHPFLYCFDCRAAAATCSLCEKKVFGGRRFCFECSKRVTTQTCPQCQRATTREAWKDGTPCPTCWKKNRREEEVREMVDACFGAGSSNDVFRP